MYHGAVKLLVEHFRCCPEELADFSATCDLSGPSGYFTIGPQLMCYGQCSSGTPAPSPSVVTHDASPSVHIKGSTIELPFDPWQVVENLRHERYLSTAKGRDQSAPTNALVRSLYYRLRPALPVSLRKHLQRLYFRFRNENSFPTWPVDRTVEGILERLLTLSMKARGVGRMPFIWFWPEGAHSCSIVTHDVETATGLGRCTKLMDLADSFGIKTSFQFVPEERYLVSEEKLDEVRERGFEVNVHDLNHDGRLFSDRREFLSRAKRINQYVNQFRASGFRSAVMYRNVDWFDALDVSYDMSVPNVAHLDPQSGGCCTVFPFFIGKVLELPLTTTQDYSLFNILNEFSTQLWKRQISLISEKHGLISFIVHPDYVDTEVTQGVYIDLLRHLSELRAQAKTWITLPRDVATWWRLRSELKLVRDGGSLRIEGVGHERARIAYAELDTDGLHYSFENALERRIPA